MQSHRCHVHRCFYGTSHPTRKLTMFTLGHILVSSEFMYVLELALNASLVSKTVCIGPVDRLLSIKWMHHRNGSVLLVTFCNRNHTCY